MQFNQYQPFEPHKPRVIFAEFDMDSLLQFPPHLRPDNSLSETWEVRLVINQSVGSSGVKSAPRDQSCLSVDCFLRLSLLLSSLYIKHYDLILPFICSYMWDLISRAHIWCAFGFVLETGCYINPSLSVVISSSWTHWQWKRAAFNRL